MASKNPAGKPATAAGQGNVRGTKRTCQNDSCGARFYDLNRDPIECPICGTPYVTHLGLESVAQSASEPGSVGRGARQSDSLPGVDVSAADDDSEIEVDEADLDAADVGLEIDDEDDADNEIEGVRGSGRGHGRPD